mmetsp:Transcript_57802/g.146716  ORF Transcript_57802/g.146716 Transcript_57802/m.146716 type:complete len:345 (-) Transcript_57802:62-1096(-)
MPMGCMPYGLIAIIGPWPAWGIPWKWPIMPIELIIAIPPPPIGPNMPGCGAIIIPWGPNIPGRAQPMLAARACCAAATSASFRIFWFVFERFLSSLSAFRTRSSATSSMSSLPLRFDLEVAALLSTGGAATNSATCRWRRSPLRFFSLPSGSQCWTASAAADAASANRRCSLLSALRFSLSDNSTPEGAARASCAKTSASGTSCPLLLFLTRRRTTPGCNTGSARSVNTTSSSWRSASCLRRRTGAPSDTTSCSMAEVTRCRLARRSPFEDLVCWCCSSAEATRRTGELLHARIPVPCRPACGETCSRSRSLSGCRRPPEATLSSSWQRLLCLDFTMPFTRKED